MRDPRADAGPGSCQASRHRPRPTHPPMHEPTRTEGNPAIEPAGRVDALARGARKARTPWGGGTMVGRVWGAGDPLVLFHGGSGSWTHWIRVIPVLAKHYELWVADIPGLGGSAMPPKPWVPQ